MSVGTADAPAFTADDLVAVAGLVWESCLAHHPDVLVEGPPAAVEGPVTQASVTIRGGWAGVVVLEMGSATAEEAARVMLDLDAADDAAPEEVADAVGELVNIIGGNVKSLLPSASTLGLPQVVGDAATGCTSPPGTADIGTVEHCRADLSWGARPVLVRVCS